MTHAVPFARRTLLTGGLALTGGALVGCGADDSAAPTGATTPTAPTAAARSVTTPLGAVEVPAMAQRVVALDYFTGLAHDLGVPLVGRDAYVPVTLVDDAAYTALPAVSTTDGLVETEKVLALEADLLISTQYQVAQAPEALASSVALVQVPDDFVLDWRATALLLGEATGVTGVQQRLDDGDARAAELGTELGLVGHTVAVLRPMGDGQVRVHGPGSFCGDVLRTIGYQVQEVGGEAIATISVEVLDQVTAEEIYLWTDATGVSVDDIEAKLDEVRTSGVFAALPAVRDGRVHLVGEVWIGMDFTAWDVVLDDVRTAQAG